MYETMSMSPILVLIGFLVVVGVLIYYYYYQEKKRTAALQQTALRLGLQFAKEDNGMLKAELGRLNLFSQGHSQRCLNIMQGSVRNANTAVFDYRYVTGHGKNRHVHTQTVVSFQIQAPILPIFCLRPENLMHKMGQWFGYQDIDFPRYPGFSSRYLLRGNDETAIRNIFNDSILRFYEGLQGKGICTEGAGNRLVLYRQSHRVKPEELAPFIDEGFRILNLFQATY